MHVTLADGATRGPTAWRARATALVTDLTPGQRWTASLMLGLAVLILAFGLPSATSVLITPPAAAEQRAASPRRAPTAPTPVSASSPPVDSAPVADAPAPPVPIIDPSPAIVPPPLTSPTEALGVMAVVDPSFGVGGRTDEAMAEHFLGEDGVDAPIVTSDAACSRAAGTDLALAAGPLPAGVVTCLRRAGALVVAWDDTAKISLRRGVARSLLDTALTMRGDFTGRVALVADRRFKASVTPALRAAKSHGLVIDSVVWLDGAPSPQVAIDLASEATDVVLFATSTDNQSTVASQLLPLDAGVQFVVLDAEDSVVNGHTSPALDGARAATSVQFPWHSGNGDVRTHCRDSWEKAQTPPTSLGDDELLRALVWCEVAGLARTLQPGITPLGNIGIRSPVTTDVSELADGGYAPRAVAVAKWAAACECWSTKDEFAEPQR